MRQNTDFGYYYWGAFGTILVSVVFFKKIYPKIYNLIININSNDNDNNE